MREKLIDIENATITWSESDKAEYMNDFEGGVLYALDYLSEKEPAIDAVEVVRCKDCRHKKTCGHTRRLGINGYCSEGERKE